MVMVPLRRQMVISPDVFVTKFVGNQCGKLLRLTSRKALADAENPISFHAIRRMPALRR